MISPARFTGARAVWCHAPLWHVPSLRDRLRPSSGWATDPISPGRAADTRAELRAAYRARLRQVHPDTVAYAAVPEVEAAALDRPEVAELMWARDALLRIVHDPVTGKDVRTADLISRNGTVEPVPPRAGRCVRAAAVNASPTTVSRTGSTVRTAGAATAGH